MTPIPSLPTWERRFLPSNSPFKVEKESSLSRTCPLLVCKYIMWYESMSVSCPWRGSWVGLPTPRVTSSSPHRLRCIVLLSLCPSSGQCRRWDHGRTRSVGGSPPPTTALVSSPIPSGKLVGADTGEEAGGGPAGHVERMWPPLWGCPCAQSDRPGPVGFLYHLA